MKTEELLKEFKKLDKDREMETQKGSDIADRLWRKAYKMPKTKEEYNTLASDITEFINNDNNSKKDVDKIRLYLPRMALLHSAIFGNDL